MFFNKSYLLKIIMLLLTIYLTSGNQAFSQDEKEPPQTSINSPAFTRDYNILRVYNSEIIEYMMSSEYKAALKLEFYRLVNAHRRANNLRDLEVNTDLEVYADIRAAEQRVRFGHTRPNGSIAGSGWHNSRNHMNTRFAENAYSVMHLHPDPLITANYVFYGWKNSSGHNRHMLYNFSSEVTMALGVVPELSEYINRRFVISVEGNYVTSGFIFATGW